MTKGVSFATWEEANEYIKTLQEQGFDGTIISDKEMGTYKAKIVPREQKIKVGKPRDVSGRIGRTAKWIGVGIQKAGQSLGTPSTSKRPRISQLPSSRREIGISQQPNLEYLKMPGLRGKSISGLDRR